jgi:hypothetical protein
MYRLRELVRSLRGAGRRILTMQGRRRRKRDQERREMSEALIEEREREQGQRIYFSAYY